MTASKKLILFLKSELCQECLLLALVLTMMIAWSLVAGDAGEKPAGPDEPMRYAVARYIAENPGKLPRGDDPALRDKNWGFSYAYYPILSYIISGIFMWVAGLFHASENTLLHVARIPDAIFITIAAWYLLRIGKRRFGRDQGTFYAVLVIFLPGFHYLGTYINSDSMALMASAMMIYAWVRVLDEGWTWKNCIRLAVGMGICLQTYYYAYGWILFSFFFYCITILKCTDEPWKQRFSFLISRGLVISAVTLALSAWWFIRSLILYGDIFGRKASAIAGELYAIPGLKPSDHFTPAKGGWSLWDFLIYQNPGWPHNWLILSLISFIGTFGHFDLYMEETVSKIYLVILLLGVLGMLLMLQKFAWRRRVVHVEREDHSLYTIRTRSVVRYKAWDREGIFHLCMLGGMIVPMILYFYYTYFVDVQAQGRYFMASVFAIMYFVTMGYGAFLSKLIRREQIRSRIWQAASVVWILAAAANFFMIIIPAYR